MLALVASSTSAYEVDTHAVMSQVAFGRSVLASPDVADRLGWSRYPTPAPFRPPSANPDTFFTGDRYVDLTQALWTQSGQAGFADRLAGVYERNQMPAGYRGASGIDPVDYVAWLMRGAIREDDLPTSAYRREPPPDSDPYGSFFRVFNHFYDPINDRALTVLAPCATIQTDGSDCVRSSDWAMGATGVASLGVAMPPAANPSRRNHFSWADGREAMWCGLTYRRSQVSPQRDAATRRLCWATTLKSLGNVLHLVQDGAQPQHVRNDRHNPVEDVESLDLAGFQTAFGNIFATSIARRTFENYTNWRATGGEEIGGAGSEETAFRSMFTTVSTTAPPLVLSNGYPIPRFAQPIDYLTTRGRTSNNTIGSVNSRRGMADFANRNFFSEGTLFSTEFPLPPPSDSDPGWVVVNTTPVPVPGRGSYTEREFRWAPSDAVAPGFIDPALASTGGRIPLARESMWKEFTQGGVSTSTTQGIPLDYYRQHADVLIPRAVAYSAGLIDFFFRGELEVSEPSSSLLSTLDQGTPHTVDANGYPRRTDNGQVLGFTSLRLRVRNLTPDISESGTGRAVAQLASDGRIVAVARYHRNLCYRADLTGELTNIRPGGQISVPSGCAPSQLRTNYEELSVSAPITIANQLDQSQASGFVFDFAADPIPVNATDLRVQVVYRGWLGEERDGIAVGLLDVPEPFWIVGLNMTDYYGENSQWLPSFPAGSPAQRPVAANAINGVWRDVAGNPATANAVYGINANLPSGRLVRIAVIGRIPQGQLQTTLTFVAPPSPDPPYIQPAPILSSAFSMNLSRQYTSEVAPSGLYAPAPATGVRGVGFDRLAFFFLSNDSTTGPDIATLPPMANVLPMPNVVVLATLPPPEAPSAAWVPADLAEHDERSGSRGEGRDYAADPLPKRLPH